jgi:hypothetical protein
VTKKNSKKALPFEQRHEKLITVRATSKKALGKPYYRFNDNKSYRKSTTTKALGKDYYRSNDNKSRTTTKALGKSYYRSS